MYAGVVLTHAQEAFLALVFKVKGLAISRR